MEKLVGLSVLLAVALLLQPGPANASPLPQAVWTTGSAKPANGLPDGNYAIYRNGEPDAVAAWYGSPTRRYRHGILGDAIEAGSLHVTVRNGGTYELVLPDSQVFEDRTPRIVDLDQDGKFEVITIRSFLSAGGSVAVYGLRDGKLVELAATAPIGRSNRWLNIAGIADYAGRGKPQIAYVETPHIGGTLYFVEWRGTDLVPIVSINGFSNHQIGAREQGLSGDLDFDGDGRTDIAVPSNDRRTLRVIGIQDGKARELHRVAFPAAIKRTTPGALPEKACLRLELENRKSAQVCRPG